MQLYWQTGPRRDLNTTDRLCTFLPGNVFPFEAWLRFGEPLPLGSFYRQRWYHGAHREGFRGQGDSRSVHFRRQGELWTVCDQGHRSFRRAL